MAQTQKQSSFWVKYSREAVLLLSNSRYLFWIVLFTYVTLAFFNFGWIGMDEYYHNIKLFIPAESNSLENLLQHSDIRSPVQVLPFWILSQLLAWLGISDPWWQFRAVLLCWAAISAGTLYAAFSVFQSSLNRFDLKNTYLTKSHSLLIFYGLLPFIATRPMFESLALPLVALFLSHLQKAYFEKKLINIYYALFFLCLSCLFRPQIGLGILALSFVIWKVIPFKHWPWIGLYSLLLLFLSGVPDWILLGEWHQALKGYLSFNLVEHNPSKGESMFGVSPWYTYLPTFLAASWIPFFIFLKKETLKKSFLLTLPCWIFTLSFLVFHSIIPHKEERFLIPILGGVLFTIYPLWDYIVDNSGKYKYRFMGIVCLNLFVLFLSFPAMPQKNSLSLIRHLEKSPEIAAVTKRRKTQILIPSALLSRDFKIRKLTDKKLENLNHENCRGHYVFRYDDLVKGRVPNGLKKIAEFSPSVVDAWVVALNPKRNARRGSLSLYQCPEIQRSQ